jgi:hypothetical protein
MAAVLEIAFLIALSACSLGVVGLLILFAASIWGKAMDKLHEEVRKEAADLEYKRNRNDFMYWKYMVKD